MSKKKIQKNFSKRTLKKIPSYVVKKKWQKNQKMQILPSLCSERSLSSLKNILFQCTFAYSTKGNVLTSIWIDIYTICYEFVTTYLFNFLITIISTIFCKV